MEARKVTPAQSQMAHAGTESQLLLSSGPASYVRLPSS